MKLAPTQIAALVALNVVMVADQCPAQSLIVPDSTVRTVVSLSLSDGHLEATGFMDLDDGAIPASRPYEAVAVGNELWFTDDITRRITRWNRFGSTQLGQIDLAPHRLRGITQAFGFVWVGAGNPDINVPDFLAQITLSGTIVALHPMPQMISGVEPYGSQLLVGMSGADDLVFVDPTTGAVGATFHDSDGVTGINFPGDIDALANGHVLVAGALSPDGVYEYDAQGNQVGFFETSSLGPGSGARGVHGLSDGNFLVTSGSKIYRYDRTTAQYEVLLSSLVAYYFAEVETVPLGTITCGGVPNSTGRPATLNGIGSSLLTDGAVRLSVQDLPIASSGLVLASTAAASVANPGGSQGTLCLGGSIGRFVQQIGFSGNDGFFSITVNTSAVPQPNGFVPILPGETWFFQAWYRDGNPGPVSNFTGATAITFQ